MDEKSPASVIGLPRHLSANVLGYGLEVITDDSDVLKALRQLHKQGAICIGYLIQLSREELLSPKFQKFMTVDIVDKIEASLLERFDLRLNSYVPQCPDFRELMGNIEKNQKGWNEQAIANMRRGREEARARRSGANVVKVDFGLGR